MSIDNGTMSHGMCHDILKNYFNIFIYNNSAVGLPLHPAIFSSTLAVCSTSLYTNE
jgi:hypothetical protein